MFSKAARKLILISMAGVLISGCSASINDTPPVVKNPEFKVGDKVQCLANVLPVMSAFVEGTAQPQEVEAVWECFRVAIGIYKTYVRGRDESQYTARELATFFEVYFLGPDVRLNDKLLLEVMRIKQIFVGGSDQTITRDELQALIGFAQDMKVITLRILPYMKVFSFHWEPLRAPGSDADLDYFENANMAIQDTAKDVAALIAKNNQSYRISNFVVLLEEISKLYNEKWSFVSELERLLPLVYKLKATLSGGSESVIESHEWRRFALLGSRGFIQYLRYFYFIKTNTTSSHSAQVSYIAKEFDDLLSYLGDMVTEKPDGIFTRTELLEVLKALTQFVPDIKVTDAFLLEVMKIKRVLFGGSLDSFTPADFAKGRSKVEVFRGLSEKLIDRLAFYSFEWKTKGLSYAAQQEYFGESEAQLAEILKGLGSLAESEYDLNDLIQLAREMDQLYPRQAKEPRWEELALKYIPIVTSGKQIIFSDETSVIRREQWPVLLRQSGQFLAKYYYYYYFINPEEIKISHGEGLLSAQKFLRETLSVMDDLIDLKKDQVIPFSDLDRMTKSILNAGFLPSYLDSKTIDNLVRVIAIKFLNTPATRFANPPVARSSAGLSHASLQVISDEMKIWFDGQVFFENLFRGVDPGTGLSTKRIQDALKVARPAGLPFNELQVMYESPQSRAFDRLGRLVISGREFPTTLDSADKVNLSRLMSRWIIRAYAGELSRAESSSFTQLSINKAELNQLYFDVKPFIVSMGLVSPANQSFATSRFLEMNLFTPRSNGDTFGNFIELGDLALGILSGLKLDELVRKRLDDPNPELGCPKVTLTGEDTRRVSVQCFADTYRNQMEQIFGSMPTLKTFMTKLPRCRLLTKHPWITNGPLRDSVSADEKDKLGEADLNAYVDACENSFDAMVLNMLKSAGYVPETKGYVKLADTSLVPHVMQYIESFMQRYDQDSNGRIDTEEMLKAYPILKDTLRDVSGYTDDKTLKALLAYFMIKGRPPQTNTEKIYFYLIFRGQENQWDVRADRLKMASILGYIADAINTGTKSLIGKDLSQQN